MSRPRLSIPHERRKAKLKAAALNAKVKIAEHRETLDRVQQELKAMSPPKKQTNEVI